MTILLLIYVGPSKPMFSFKDFTSKVDGFNSCVVACPRGSFLIWVGAFNWPRKVCLSLDVNMRICVCS